MMSVLLLQGDVAPASADAAELAGLEEVWNRAHLQGDAQALEGLWADELVVTVPKMKVLTRSDAIEMARSARMRFTRYETSDLRVRVFGDAGVVTGHLRRSRKRGETVVDDDWQFTKVYVRRTGRWRVVAFHASESPE
jgi:ketosteroid isomerase-like protein